MRLPRCRKFKGEINQSLFAQIDFAQINARRDFANLVTHPVRHQRSFGIIKNDALLAIHPARTFINLGDDRVQPKGQNLVSQSSLCWIENFSLPCKMTYEIGHVLSVSGSRCDDRRAYGFAAWDFDGWTMSEQVVELRLQPFQHLSHSQDHDIAVRSCVTRTY